ncbi:integrin alpha-3 isoform X1 [Nothobranchius furzeri]|uniref:integrin alpha-3 isoform X1 n=1 Tax=Nothobranchius furzeri TaxID=105023 RepID=UPI003904CCC4
MQTGQSGNQTDVLQQTRTSRNSRQHLQTNRNLILCKSKQVCVSMATGVCVVLSLCAGFCFAFNLDTSFPVLKRGEGGSLFGFSVTLHKDMKTGSHLLLIGAPRDWAEPNVPANRTGGVYSCPITADHLDCTRMKVVNPNLNPSKNLVEDMWLGVSVASQGGPSGRVLACAHRFVKLSSAFKHSQVGQCYLSGDDLLKDYSISSWHRLDQLCNHEQNEAGQGMCNLGISTFMSDTELIFGSPGSYHWQGSVHVVWTETDIQKNFFPNQHQRNIYLGYSVTQAHCLLSVDDVTIVTGAPRDNKEDARGSVLLLTKRSDELLIRQTLRGQQVGSYFGNAVATSDLNNDGWTDLLVGAPFYYGRQPEVGGAVYVYMNAGGRFAAEPSVTLMGPVGSAFGMAVIAAGDLNQDGFQDFAVGAPFHDTGSVMIWTGSSEGITTEPSQVIQGSSLFSGFRTFGYSLAAGLDVDGNKYPDLLVGSLDDTVALLRSRPVVHLNRSLRVSPDIVHPNSCDFCIKVEVCFSFKLSITEKAKTNITVYFTVTADVTSLKPRLHFYENGETVYSSSLSLKKRMCKTLKVGLLIPVQNKVKPLVFSLNVTLNEKLPEKGNIVQDLRQFPVLSRTPQPIRTQIHIQKACGSDNRCHCNLQMTTQFMDLNQNPFTKVNGSSVLVYNSSIRWFLLEVNISNTPSAGRPAEDAHNAVLNISIPPALSYSGVIPKADNSTLTDCSVEDTSVVCQLGNPFKSKQKDQLLIKFQPTKMILDTKEIRSLLQLSTLSEQSDLAPVYVSMLVENSLQASLILSNPPGPVFFSGQVIGEQAVKNMEDIGSLVVFTLQVHIDRESPGYHGNLEVEFDWPKEVANGKWLLYLTEIRLDGASSSRCTQSEINPLNLLVSHERKSMRRSLKGQQVEDAKEEEKGRELPAFSVWGHKNSYKLNCTDGAKCVKLSCPLLDTDNAAFVTVHSRLWNSTMIEDFSDARSILVQVQATLKLSTKLMTTLTSYPSLIEVYIYPDSALQLYSGAHLWIIIMSVLAGVLLLALICLLLWKCRFFAHQEVWQTAVVHQQKIMGRKEQLQQHAKDDGFLIQDQMFSSQKHWATF